MARGGGRPCLGVDDWSPARKLLRGHRWARAALGFGSHSSGTPLELSLQIHVPRRKRCFTVGVGATGQFPLAGWGGEQLGAPQIPGPRWSCSVELGPHCSRCVLEESWAHRPCCVSAPWCETRQCRVLGGRSWLSPGSTPTHARAVAVPWSCREAWARGSRGHSLPPPADQATYCDRSLSHILKSSVSGKPVCCPGSRGALSEDRSGAPVTHNWPEVAGPGHLPCRAPRGPAPCCWGSGGVPSPIFRITSCRAGSQNWKSWTEGVS